MGFKVVENEDDYTINDMSAWLQFVDKNGNIDKKRFNKFIKEGNIPHKSVIAYMSTEDFLKKYLPEDRKGKIKLKKTNKERADFWDKIKNDSKKVKQSWEDLIKKDSDFNEFINSAEALMKVLDFLSEKSKKDYLLFLEKMFSKKIKWDDFCKYKNDKIKLIEDEIKIIMRNDLYEEFEVLI